MSDELSAAEKIVKEVLIDLMTERVMSERGLSTGIQASLTRGLQASPSTARASPSQRADEKWTKHRDDIMKCQAYFVHSTSLPTTSEWCHQSRQCTSRL
jgi:hypothetical protein